MCTDFEAPRAGLEPATLRLKRKQARPASAGLAFEPSRTAFNTFAQIVSNRTAVADFIPYGLANMLRSIVVLPAGPASVPGAERICPRLAGAFASMTKA